MGKILRKILVNSWVVHIARNFLIMLNHLPQMHVKRLSIESFKKQQKQLLIWLVIKLLIELQKSQEVQHRIIHKQLQMNMMKKYLKKDIFPEERQKIIDNRRLM